MRSIWRSEISLSMSRWTTTAPAALQEAAFWGAAIPPTSPSPSFGPCAALKASSSVLYFARAAWCLSHGFLAPAACFRSGLSSFSVRSAPSAFVVGTPSASYSAYLSASFPSRKRTAGSARPFGSFGSLGSFPTTFALTGLTPSQMASSFLARVISLATTLSSTPARHWALRVLKTFMRPAALRALASTTCGSTLLSSSAHSALSLSAGTVAMTTFRPRPVLGFMGRRCSTSSG
mmetsp:Transcript_17375/g.46015  ORF Transcript_17375/g.46015 Transcript_17375/m.46015 type:complete len:234 (-) Transcript_17375:547-1248(-)